MTRKLLITGFVVIAFLFAASCGYHRSEIKTHPGADRLEKKTLFIAIDGIAYEMMAELKKEGHFKDWQDPVPLIVTFPSATTIGFTGLFQPLDVGTVPGYETRFYSYNKNKIVGGTPWDVYKIHINYKTYFDSFRHSMSEKGVMYSFPGVAGKQDLMRTEKLVLNSPKKILMTYLGGTDGAQHLLGRKRMKRFMVFVDRFLQRMKRRYYKKHNEPLKIVLFSDHGFDFNRLKMVSTRKIKKVFKKGGLNVAHRLEDENDVVFVKFGLLTAGVAITNPAKKEKAARLLKEVQGVDLSFWPEGKRIHMVNSKGEEAYFEYQWPRRHRYVLVNGDPLNYKETLLKNGHRPGQWVSEKRWLQITWNHYYPDAGHRLYDAFNNLVENKASVLFSLKPNYQFGGLAALAGTYLKFGHKGTHGGLFSNPSLAMVITDDPLMNLPQYIRYDNFFRVFLPRVTQAYERRNGKKEIQFLARSH